MNPARKRKYRQQLGRATRVNSHAYGPLRLNIIHRGSSPSAGDQRPTRQRQTDFKRADLASRRWWLARKNLSFQKPGLVKNIRAIQYNNPSARNKSVSPPRSIIKHLFEFLSDRGRFPSSSILETERNFGRIGRDRNHGNRKLCAGNGGIRVVQICQHRKLLICP